MNLTKQIEMARSAQSEFIRHGVKNRKLDNLIEYLITKDREARKNYRKWLKGNEDKPSWIKNWTLIRYQELAMKEPHPRIMETYPSESIDQVIEKLIDKVIIEWNEQGTDIELDQKLKSWDERYDAVDYLTSLLIKKTKEMES